MRSPRDERGSGDADDAFTTVQDTLDAFETPTVDESADALPGHQGADPAGTFTTASTPAMAPPTRQESIDRFTDRRASEQPTGPGGGAQPTTPSGPSRAMEGLALEMAMERVAMTEAATGISRDELVITVAREVQLPLERLDLVDGYITDLELEGKVRVVGDLVVLHHPDDDDLLAMDLSDEGFLARYRRRHLGAEGGGRR